MISTRAFLALLAGGLLQSAVAQTSLYIPGFDPQPISAGIIGVGSDGRTTWQLQPGVTSGSFDDIGLIGTATLVAGPNDVKVIIDSNGLVLNEDCAINGNIADCTVVAVVDGTTTTDTAQDTVSPFEIQPGSVATSAGSQATPAPSSGASTSGSSGSSQAGSTPSGGASQTSVAVPSSTQGNNNGGVGLGVSSLFWAVGGLSIFVLV
ncbi:hypothetical protein QCA50_003494 [Cerrena zonata]|uniref:Uncharacterized protein n=1 Tax=Cerrena zonata TaxID=2478898 RepID=A0AAW0GS84_9APHY